MRIRTERRRAAALPPSSRGCAAEQLERRVLLSAALSRPGTPHVSGIADAGANVVTWRASIDAAGQGITYTLQYDQRGGPGWTTAGVTSGTSLPLCGGSAANPILSRTTYALRVEANDPAGHTAYSGMNSFTTAGPLTPAAIRRAYGLGAPRATDTGRGETIALVELGEDPTLLADVTGFDKAYHLAAPDLQVVNQYGADAPLPTFANADREIALDVEWAHAIAPGAKLLLLEGTDVGSLADLMTGAMTAAQMGASVVSMSYGFTQAALDAAYPGGVPAADAAVFATPGVTFVAAAGDQFAEPAWPAVSPDVLSVGGTQLSVGPNGGYGQEIDWHDVAPGAVADRTGGGFGAFTGSDDPDPKQTPDVSYAADGYAYYTDGQMRTEGLGTSFGAPQWAALVALVDADRPKADAYDSNASAGHPSLQAALDAAPATDFHLNTASAGETASEGSSPNTGLGTPTGKLLRFLATHAG